MAVSDLVNIGENIIQIQTARTRDCENCPALMLTPMLHLAQRVPAPFQRSSGGARTRKKRIGS
jgi:hypothetical protein